MTEAPSTFGNEQNAIEAAGQRGAEEGQKAAEEAVARVATQFVRATVLDVDDENLVQIQRTHMDEPDAAYYPVLGVGEMPAVDDEIFALATEGILFIMGRMASGTFRDLLLVDEQAKAATPIGAVLEYALPTLPADGRWVWTNGQTELIASYPDLFALMGTTHNTGGEAAGSFRMPDHRGRAAIGAGTGSGLTARVLGTRGGEENHAMTTGEMASHGHTTANHDHNHLAFDPARGAFSCGVTNTNDHDHGDTSNASDTHSHTAMAASHDAGAGSEGQGWPSGNVHNSFRTSDRGRSFAVHAAAVSQSGAGHFHGIANNNHGHYVDGLNTVSHSHTVNNTGSNTPHNTMPPYIVMNFILRAKI